MLGTGVDVKTAHRGTSQALTLPIRPVVVLAAMLVVIAVLAGLSVTSRLAMLAIDGETYRGLREIAYRLDMDRENTVPAWYSSLTLLLAGGLLGVVAWITRVRKLGFFWHWVVLAVGFAYLSLDESACLHEILIVPLRRRLGTSGILYFAWVIPGFFAVLICAATYLRFLCRLRRKTMWWFLAAGAIFVGGALGMELVGGALAEARGLDDPLYMAVMTIEETLEMVGVAVFTYALLDYLSHLTGPVPLRMAIGCEPVAS